MHRDKTVARIILVLSIVHGALAAPVVVQQRYLDIAEDVTAPLEKRSSDDESPHPGSVVSVPESDSYFTARSSSYGSNRYSTTPVSGARQLHSNPQAGSGTLKTRDDLPGTSGAPPSQDHPPPALGDSQLHNDPPAGSGTPQVHNDPPATLGAPPSHDDSPPASGTPRLHDDPPATSGASSSQNDPSPESGDPQLHNDPTTSRLGAPQVHFDLSPGEFDDSYRYLNGYRFPGATPSESSHSESEAPGGSHSGAPGPLPQNDPSPLGGPRLHNNPTTQTLGDLLAHNDLSSGELDGSYRWLNGYRFAGATPLHSPHSESETLGVASHSESQLHNDPPAGSEGVQGESSSSRSSMYSNSGGSQPTNSEAEGFFNDARKKKLKLYGKVGATIGITGAILYGLGKVLLPYEPKSGPNGRDLASSEVIDRGASMHPRSQKKPVLHALALASLMTRNEDLQLLSVLRSRALERFD